MAAVMDASYRPFELLGILFIVCGIILIALPFIARNMPSLENLPWILIWVYRSDGFFFVTSPLLIIISIISLILQLIHRSG
jgi:hypothetical protein